MCTRAGCPSVSAASMMHFTVRASGRPSSAATSSQVACPGVGTFCIGSAGAGRDARRRERLGQLDVGRVIGRGTPGDRVLARIREHLELVRRAAADRPGVRRDGAELRAPSA